MKKRILSMIMVSILVLSFAACQKTSEPASNDTSDTLTSAPDSTTKTPESTDDAQGSTDAAADPSLQYILDKGEFILGLDDSFPPMGFTDDKGDIIGFDIDLAKAVCEKLGVELKCQPIDWETKEQELNTKNIDCIWNGLSVTPDRLENMTMSKPYLTNNISLVVTSTSDITSMADMAGKKLGIQGGSSAEEVLNDSANTAFRDSLAEVLPFEKYDTALMDMETGNSDAVLMDTIVANYMITSLGKSYKVLNETLLADAYAIGFRKGDQSLCDAVDNALTELKAEGKIEEIATKWFGGDITTIE